MDAIWEITNPFRAKKRARKIAQQAKPHTQIMQELERRQMVFNGLLATSACLGFGVATWQGCQTQSTVKQMQLDGRPWLQVRAKVNEPAPGHLMCRLHLINYGRSPAFIESVKFSSVAVSMPLAESDADKWFRKHEREGIQLTQHNLVPAGQEAILPFPDPLFVDKEITEEMLSGKSSLMLFATVAYTDAGGAQRESQGCFLYSARFDDLTEYQEYNYMK